MIDHNRLTRHLANRLPQYLDELRLLCAIECPTESKIGVDTAATWVADWAARRGWEVRRWAHATAGDNLLVSIRGHGTARILLVAHLDTVYPVGTAAARPMRIEQDMLLAPGSCDNKSGLLSGLYAMEAIVELGLSDQIGVVSLFCGSDEETDWQASAPLLAELAPAYDLALVLEAARENGDIVSARKGIGHFTLVAHGRAAHAGVEPERGANAIVALARQITSLAGLNGLCDGMTLNVGRIVGGGPTNVVPDLAAAEFEVRIVHPDDRGVVDAALADLGDRIPLPGVAYDLQGGWGPAPMARTAAIERLAAVARRCAADLGFDLTDAATGGVSYANLLAGLGLPVLDGLGPVGGNDHSPAEYIAISSIVPRTSLLALLVMYAGV
ncbi:MAG TPA: M20 family metallopeptidase [Roseiflexaceae bacterium]|nr:M20 family metallopeptidase [Roseiflexaceae bacterium]HMP39332.1 M20 family metallopeptidase [Roseiflexaceae bacterium]